MSSFQPLGERHVLPIWRPTGTIAGAEARAIPAGKKAARSRFVVLERKAGEVLHRFMEAPSVALGCEALEAAMISGSHRDLGLLKKIVLGELPGRPKEVAAIQAFPEHRQPSGAFNKTEGLSRSDARTYIRSLKHKLSEEPRLALSWCDRALAYTILGQDEKAEWCIKIALALAPTHRGVVRVAVRFYAHIEEADHAHCETGLARIAVGYDSDVDARVGRPRRSGQRPSCDHSSGW